MLVVYMADHYIENIIDYPLLTDGIGHKKVIFPNLVIIYTVSELT
jgi:hypothetical protein